MQVETVLEQLFFTTTYIETTSGGSKASGTGFIYNVEIGDDQAVGLLVTNKHVIEGADLASIRLIAATDSERSGPALGEVHYVNLEAPESRFTGHPDPQTDVTMVPISPAINILQEQGDYVFYRALQSSLAMTDEISQTLDALEEVTFIGYPNGLYDQVNYLPLARRGHTASPPSVDYGGQPLLLIDASVFPGSSGSPVLVAQTGTFSTRGAVVAGNRLVLLGILAAVYQRHVPVLQVPTGLQSIVEDAIDIGVVYKARAIDETADLVLAQYGLQRRQPVQAEPVAEPNPDQDAIAQQ